MADTVNTELIRGHVDTIILRTLVLGDSYPYDILKQISEKTQGRYQLKQATLYSCMKRLEKSGLITSYWGDQSDGGRRKYYSLTDQGRAMLERDQAEWEYSRTIINNLLSDKDFDLAKDEAPFDASSLRPLTRRTKTAEELDEDEAECKQEILVSTPYMVHKDATREENNPPVSLFDYAERREEEELDRELAQEKISEQAKEIVAEQPKESPSLSIEQARQMAEASKLLQIGNFAPTMTWDPERDTITPTVVNDDSVYTTRDTSDTYIKKLDNLFGAGDAEVSLPNIEPIVEAPSAEINLIQFNDLKNTMLQQGYRLRMYNRPDELSRKYLKYIFANKLMRDSYLALFIPLLILYIVTLSVKVYENVVVNVLLGISIGLVAVLPTILYLRNPNKRTREEYQFSHNIVIRAIIAMLAMIVSFIVLMFACNVNIADHPLKYIIAWLYCLMVPIYSVIYLLLLKRKSYYLDK